MRHEPLRSGVDPMANTVGRDEARTLVLLVEDERLIRLALTSVLKARGYEVLAAATAEEALHSSALEPAAIDLLLSDVTLPGRSGVELARELRERGLRCPVVFMSALSGEGLQRVGVGPDVPVLAKPFEKQELLDRLDELLGAA